MSDLGAGVTELAGTLSEDLRIVGLVAGSDAGDAVHRAVVETATALGANRRILLANLREGDTSLDDYLDVTEEAGVWDVLASRRRLGEVAVRVGGRPFLYLPGGGGEEASRGELTGLAERVRQAEGTLLLYLEPGLLEREDLRGAVDGIVTVGPVELEPETLGLEVLGRLQAEAEKTAEAGPVSEGEPGREPGAEDSAAEEGEPEHDEIGLDELEAADLEAEEAGPEEPVSGDLAAAEEADAGWDSPSFEGPDEVTLERPEDGGEAVEEEPEEPEAAPPVGETGGEEPAEPEPAEPGPSFHREPSGGGESPEEEEAFAGTPPTEEEPAPPEEGEEPAFGEEEEPAFAAASAAASADEPGGFGAEPPSDEAEPSGEAPEETPVGGEGGAAGGGDSTGAGDGGWRRHRQQSGTPWGRIVAGAAVVLLLVGGWWWFAGRATGGAGEEGAAGTPDAAAPAEAADTSAAGQAREAATGEPESGTESAAAEEPAGGAGGRPEIPENLRSVLEGAPTSGYSVLVASYRGWEAASSRARRWSEEDGRLYFVAPTSLQGGLYYRVFAGGTGSRSGAEELIVSLVDEGRKERVSAWDARPVSRAFRLGAYGSRREAERAVRSHHDRRIPAYVMEASSGGQTAYVLYAGAYTSSDAAEGLRSQLTEAGISAPLVTRKGRPLTR